MRLDIRNSLLQRGRREITVERHMIDVIYRSARFIEAILRGIARGERVATATGRVLESIESFLCRCSNHVTIDQYRRCAIVTFAIQREKVNGKVLDVFSMGCDCVEYGRVPRRMPKARCQLLFCPILPTMSSMTCVSQNEHACLTSVTACA